MGLIWQWLRLPDDVVFALGALLMAYDFIIKLHTFFPKFFNERTEEDITEKVS